MRHLQTNKLLLTIKKEKETLWQAKKLLGSLKSSITKFSLWLTLSHTTNLGLREFADDNFRFDENGRKFSKRTENVVGKKEKLIVTSNFSFSQSVFKRLVLQTHKNKGLFGKGLICNTCLDMVL